MRIGVNINCLLNQWTGIQQYVDSLMTALYSTATDYDIVAFAPEFHSSRLRSVLLSDSRMQWSLNKKARIDTAGSDCDFKGLSILQKSDMLQVWANRLDGGLTAPLKSLTMPLRRQWASGRYDLLHTPDAHHLEFFEYKAKNNVVTIYDLTTVTCPHTHNKDNIDIWDRYYDYAKNCCARVITVSEYSKSDIIEYLKIPADRIDVTPLAPRATTQRITDPALLNWALSQMGLKDIPFILYSGTIEPRKNLCTLIRAFARMVKEAHLSDHKLVLAGGTRGTCGEELMSLAQAIGISDQVVMPGYVSNHEMNALMSSCTAFAYVSEYEGFGLPPLEAMACGAPVVTSSTTSLPEVVGEAGIQADPRDEEGIASALHLLITDPDENQRRRTLSLARAKLFSWENTARLTLESYAAALA